MASSKGFTAAINYAAAALGVLNFKAPFGSFNTQHSGQIAEIELSASDQGFAGAWGTHTCTCTYANTCIYIRIHTYACMLCMYVCTYIVYIYTNIYTDLRHTRARAHTHTV